jgi:hypothetical protein
MWGTTTWTRKASHDIFITLTSHLMYKASVTKRCCALREPATRKYKYVVCRGSVHNRTSTPHEASGLLRVLCKSIQQSQEELAAQPNGGVGGGSNEEGRKVHLSLFFFPFPISCDPIHRIIGADSGVFASGPASDKIQPAIQVPGLVLSPRPAFCSAPLV